MGYDTAQMLNPDGHPWVAATLDFAMRPLQDMRPRVVGHASGHVLEVGVGTGLNLAHYDAAKVTDWVGVEPDPHMVKRASPRIAEIGFPTQLLQIGAESLPFDDDHFDSIVITFAMCTIPDLPAAIAEARRVLRPGGQLLFAEHTLADHRPMQAFQNAITPVWKQLAGGCFLNRDPAALLLAAGFEGEIHGSGRTMLNFTPVHWGLLTLAAMPPIGDPPR